MKRIMNMKNFFASSAWRLEGAARRAATALLLCVMTTMTAWASDPAGYDYIDASGTTHNTAMDGIGENDNPTVINSTNMPTTLSGWYVVTESVTYDATVSLNGSTTIILKNGCTMSIGEDADGKRIDGKGIYGPSYFPLTIYGQSLDDATAGHLKVFTTDFLGYGIADSPYTQHSGNVTVKATGDWAIKSDGDITVNGGTLSVTSLASSAVVAASGGNIIINGGKVNATNSTDMALYSLTGNVTINGGQVEATGAYYGIYASDGTITLGWTNATDYIRASSYYGTVQVADGLAFLTDDATPQQVSGTVGNLSLIDGKKLSPDLASVFTANGDGSYTIVNAYGWGLFCDRLAAADGKTFFSGKTVRLAGDITVSRMAGGQPFTGIFDGDGHTLTLNYGTADAPVDAQFVAPFVATSSDGNHQPVFRNLTIDGTIYDNYSGVEAHNVGGLIGHLYGDVTIEHCTSRVHITSVGGAGGFVGLCEHTAMFTDCVSSTAITSPGGNNSGFVSWSRASGHAISFEGCVFNGKLLQQNGNGASNGCFIGWTGSNKTVTFTNCLCAPAATTSGETMATGNSATFARGWNATTTATNSYYTQDFNDGEHNTGQGKQLRTITAGDYVTTLANAGTVSNNYTTSGLIFYNVGLKYGDVLYAASNDEVSLTLGCTAPSGYYCTGYTATAGILNGTTLTMPNGNVTINATLTPTISYIDENGETQQCANYTLLNDTETTLGTSGQETWYVADGTLNYGQTITISGNVHLILKDNAVMNVGTEETPVNGNGIYSEGHSISIYAQSTGESQGQLHLNASLNGYSGIKAQNSSITINGGEVEAIGASGIYASVNINSGKVTAFGSNGYGIIVENDNVTINGGQMSANNITALGGSITINGGQVTANEINANGSSVTINGGQVTVNSIAAYVGNITLGWSNASDFIFAGSYSVIEYGTLSIAEGKAFINAEGDIYESGTVNASDINGKTLRPYSNSMLFLADDADNTAIISKFNSQPYNVTLAGRKLYKDGAWNTLCLPFDVVVGSGQMAGATAMTMNAAQSGFDSASGLLTLYFDGVGEGSTIAAGTPFIVKWTGEDVTSPVFSGVTVSSTEAGSVLSTDGYVTFHGTYDKQEYTSEDKSILFLGDENTLYWPLSGATIGAFRAYFHVDLNGGANAVRSFVLNFGDSSESTGIREIDTDPAPSPSPTGVGRNAAWYTLDGRKLSGKPTKSGVYIHNGRKVVIK